MEKELIKKLEEYDFDYTEAKSKLTKQEVSYIEEQLAEYNNYVKEIANDVEQFLSETKKIIEETEVLNLSSTKDLDLVIDMYDKVMKAFSDSNNLNTALLDIEFSIKEDLLILVDFFESGIFQIKDYPILFSVHYYQSTNEFTSDLEDYYNAVAEISFLEEKSEKEQLLISWDMTEVELEEKIEEYNIEVKNTADSLINLIEEYKLIGINDSEFNSLELELENTNYLESEYLEENLEKESDIERLKNYIKNGELEIGDNNSLYDIANGYGSFSLIEKLEYLKEQKKLNEGV